MFDHLTAFRAGEFEAKFSEVSTETRETLQGHLVESDLERFMPMSIWVDFVSGLDAGKPRALAETFDESPKLLKDHRAKIRDLLFRTYVDPLVRAISCLKADRHDDSVRADSNLVDLAESFRSRILEENNRGDAFDQDSWRRLLEKFDRTTASLNVRIAESVPRRAGDCAKNPVATAKAHLERVNGLQENNDAKDLFAHTTRAISALKSNHDLESFRLAWLDPYIVAVEADLLALVSSQTKKASFLVEIQDSYPENEPFVGPGLANLNYQIAESMNLSDSSWGIEDKTDAISRAISQADGLLREGRSYFDEKKNNISLESQAEFKTLYMENKIIFSGILVEMIDLQALSGKVDPALRRQWSEAFALLEDVTALPDGSSQNGRGSRLANDEKQLWAKAFADISPENELDLYADIALGSVLLASDHGHAPATACAAAWSYLSRAKHDISKLGHSKAYAKRQAGYLSQIKERIDASCA